MTHAKTRKVWKRVSKRRPCPICQRPDWCLYDGPENDPTAVICARVESYKCCGEAGWLHRLHDDGYHTMAAGKLYHKGPCRRRLYVPSAQKRCTCGLTKALNALAEAME